VPPVFRARKARPYGNLTRRSPPTMTGLYCIHSPPTSVAAIVRVGYHTDGAGSYGRYGSVAYIRDKPAPTDVGLGVGGRSASWLRLTFEPLTCRRSIFDKQILSTGESWVSQHLVCTIKRQYWDDRRPKKVISLGKVWTIALSSTLIRLAPSTSPSRGLPPCLRCSWYSAAILRASIQ
jgi:hypothetical protein